MHTPGPWFVDWDDDGEDGWNHHIMASPDNRLCFMAHNGPEHSKEFAANARLIAAAPEMLAALCRAATMLSIVKDAGEFECSNTLDQCHAAIAKAEGNVALTSALRETESK